MNGLEVGKPEWFYLPFSREFGPHVGVFLVGATVREPVILYDELHPDSGLFQLQEMAATFTATQSIPTPTPAIFNSRHMLTPFRHIQILLQPMLLLSVTLHHIPGTANAHNSPDDCWESLPIDGPRGESTRALANL